MAPTFAIGIGSDAPIRSPATANLFRKHPRRVDSPRAAAISKLTRRKVFTAIAKAKVKAKARAATTILAALAMLRAKVTARTKSIDAARVAARLPNGAPGHNANRIGNLPATDPTRPRLENIRLVVDRGITAPRKPRLQSPPRGGTSKRKMTTKKVLARRDTSL